MLPEPLRGKVETDYVIGAAGVIGALIWLLSIALFGLLLGGGPEPRGGADMIVLIPVAGAVFLGAVGFRLFSDASFGSVVLGAIAAIVALVLYACANSGAERAVAGLPLLVVAPAAAVPAFLVVPSRRPADDASHARAADSLVAFGSWPATNAPPSGRTMASLDTVPSVRRLVIPVRERQ